MKLTEKELYIIQAALVKYIDSLQMSNWRILRVLGWKNAEIDCDDKRDLINTSHTILDKIKQEIIEKDV